MGEWGRHCGATTPLGAGSEQSGAPTELAAHQPVPARRLTPRGASLDGGHRTLYAAPASDSCYYPDLGRRRPVRFVGLGRLLCLDSSEDVVLDIYGTLLNAQ